MFEDATKNEKGAFRPYDTALLEKLDVNRFFRAHQLAVKGEEENEKKGTS